jgi:predicted aspartyl protease
MRNPLLLVWIVGALASTFPAQAIVDCRPELKASFELGTDWYGGVYVPARVSGMTLKLLVDTGGTYSMLTDSTVASLGLFRHRSRSPGMTLYGGETLDHFVMVNDMRIGTIAANTVDFLVMPDARLPSELSGTLAPDVLSRFDVDFDFADARLNLFAPKRCGGPAALSASGKIDRIPIRLDEQKHVIIPVQVDGRNLTAYLDTGASRSEMSMEAARDLFGLRPSSPGVRSLTEANNGEGIFYYPFKTLTFDGVTVNAPYLPLVPNRLARRPLGGPQLILGMAVLRHYRLYIAYSERYLYVTPATAH